MDETTFIENANLLARLNGYISRGQLKGLAFVATTCDGNIVTGYSGSYSANPTDGLMPVTMLQTQMIDAADDRRGRRHGDHAILRRV